MVLREGSPVEALIAWSSAWVVTVTMGCAFRGPPAPEQPAPPWDEDELASKERPHDPDAEIAMRLIEALVRDAALGRSLIDVRVDAGVVTLLGMADGREALDRALHLAEGVPGVRAVYNGMDVKSRASEDDSASFASTEP